METSVNCQKAEDDVKANEFWTAFKKGDEDAFCGLVSLYSVAFRRFIYGYVYNNEDAEDIVVEAFARFSLSSFKCGAKASLKTFLFKIGRNLALTFLKKKRRYQTVELNEIVATADFYTPEKALTEKEDYQTLQTLLGSLKADYKEALYLVCIEKMSYKQAAKIMKISEKKITNLIYRAKSSVKNKMEVNSHVYE